MPATSPYGPRAPTYVRDPVQRLTTAPPRRHAPRFFLSERPVANPGPKRGVLGQTGAPLSPRTPPTCRNAPPLSAPGGRTTPPDCR
ncbi:hypothetical protein F8R89_15585 [Streptomyces sp. SS1-1]|nr:hypothetical protein F8R89_15585 [Streptomyces sp. SS1-1]